MRKKNTGRATPRSSSDPVLNVLRNRVRGALKSALGRHWNRLVTMKVVANLKQVEIKFGNLSRNVIVRVKAALKQVADNIRGAQYCQDAHVIRLA